MAFLTKSSLFARTSLILTFSLVLFMLLTTTFVWRFILDPLGNRAAQDMAALITVSAKTWSMLTPAQRQTFQTQLLQQHTLILSTEKIKTKQLEKTYPFVQRLAYALGHQNGRNILIQQGVSQDDTFWADMSYLHEDLKVGFLHARFGPHPPLAIAGIFLTTAILILTTTLLLVRHITLPLKKLSRATRQFASGNFSVCIAESGPAEFAALAGSFNQMAKKVAELMANRSLLFGGISHDLRAPITRMQLAVELIGSEHNQALTTSMKNDLAEMEHLIRQALELIKGLEKKQKTPTDINALLADIAATYQQRESQLELNADTCQPCLIEVESLQRILINLLENAFRYGQNQPVKLHFKNNKHALEFSVLDHGPGIPHDKLEAVMQPFYRLDNSRNKKTGGSGLGLAIVKQLCDAHGWQIKLISAGQGLLATLTIPL